MLIFLLGDGEHEEGVEASLGTSRGGSAAALSRCERSHLIVWHVPFATNQVQQLQLPLSPTIPSPIAQEKESEA